MTPLPAPRALDQFFLEARAKLLDLAAIFDRVGRGADGAAAAADPRAAKLAAAVRVLQSDAANKAEQVQQLFSIEYDAGWDRPRPRF